MIVKKVKKFTKNKKDVAAGVGISTAGLGLTVGGGLSGDILSLKLRESLEDGNALTKTADNNKIYNKLLKEAKKQGTRVYEEPEFNNSAYTGSRVGKRVRNTVAMAERKLKKSETGREFVNNLNTAIKYSADGNAFKHLGKDRIIIGGDHAGSAPILSHELGHSKYMKSGRSKSLVGKAAHKLMPISSMSTLSQLGALGHSINGIHSGLKEEKNKSEGKKTSKWTKAKASVVPAAPLLIAEGKASLNGLKTMKKLGASKELLKQSKKDLGKAWGTYAGQASKNVVLGEGSRWIGKGIGKIKYSKDNNSKENSK